MKTSALIQKVATLAAASLALASFTGCKSTNYVRSDAAAGQLQTTANETRASAANLDATISVLNDLLTNPAGDLRVQYTRFSTNLDGLVAANNRVASEAPGLERHSASYFTNWDKEILKMNDEQIRRSSADRKAEAMSQYSATMHRYQSAQQTLAPVIAYLQDIRKALSTDLTLAGLQSVKTAANSANEKASTARSELIQLATELDALAAKMSFFVPPARSGS